MWIVFKYEYLAYGLHNIAKIDPDLDRRFPNIRAFRKLNKAVINELPYFISSLFFYFSSKNFMCQEGCQLFEGFSVTNNGKTSCVIIKRRSLFVTIKNYPLLAGLDILTETYVNEKYRSQIKIHKYAESHIYLI